MRIALLCLILLSLPLQAEIYTYIDAEGNRVFTDRPGAGNAQRVTTTPANSMPAPPPPPSAAPAQTATPALAYQMLRILLPVPDATIRDNAGKLIVTATSEPALHPGHGYRLLLDGQVQGPAGRSPVFVVNNLDRGTHQLAVEIVDAQARIVERTPSQPLHMQRMTLAQKRRIRPCQKADYGVRPECPLKDRPAEKSDIPFIPFL